MQKSINLYQKDINSVVEKDGEALLNKEENKRVSFWAIGDLHLSLGMREDKRKPMDQFGDYWIQHAAKIAHQWCSKVQEEDVVLLAGDLFWGNRLDEAEFVLNWLGCLPGQKVLIRGNHDNWWQSITKLRDMLPEGMYAIQNDCVVIQGVAIAGTRGWSFCDPEGLEHQEKMLKRETARLEVSLSHIPETVEERIALLHYPPFPNDGPSGENVALLEKYAVQTCVFGHLHGEEAERFCDVKKNGIHYLLVSADNLDFSPVCIYNTIYKRDRARYY